MRLATLTLSMTVLGLALISTPTWATMGGQSTDGGQQSSSSGPHNFGRFVCPQHLPCPPDYSTSNAAYAANANSCITQFFGYTSGDGFFENTGLDHSNCLRPKSGVLPKGMGAELQQQCCIIALPDKSCTFRCELNTK